MICSSIKACHQKFISMPLLMSLCGAILGLVLPFITSFSSPIKLGIAVCFLILALLLVMKKLVPHIHHQDTQGNIKLFIYVMMIASVFSFVRLLHIHSTQLKDNFKPTTINVVAKVISLPEYKEKTNYRVQKFTVQTLNVEKNKLALNNNIKKIAVSWYSLDKKVRVGDVWRFTLKVKNPRSYLNKGSFDYRIWLLSRGITSRASVKSATLVSQSHKQFSWNRLREKFRDKILLFSNSTQLDLLLALTIGDRSLLDSQRWETFKATGTSHLIAISGLHVGMFAGLVYLFVTWLLNLFLTPLKWHPRFCYASIICLLLSFIYCGLAGFSLPTQRALIMLTCVLSSKIFKLQISLLNRLLIALVIILIVDPFAVFFTGIFLSFLTVVSLCLSLGGQLKIKNGLHAALFSQLYLFWLLLPLGLLYFQMFSWQSSFVNLFAIPFFGLFVLPMILIFLACYSLSSFNILNSDIVDTVFFALNKTLEVFTVFINYCSSITFEWSFLFNMPSINKTVILILIFIAFLYSIFKFKTLIVIYLSILSSSCIPEFYREHVPHPYLTHKKSKPPLALHILDVGQGLSVLVETTNNSLLYDVGAAYASGFNLSDSVIVPFLYQHGITRLNALVLSHDDNDHAGSVEYLAKKISIEKLLVGDPLSLNRLENREISTKTIKKDICNQQRWVWDDVIFSVLYANPDDPVSNNRSCVLRIQWKDQVLLLSGDISKKAERLIVDKYNPATLSTVVLIAPHHGSRTSSSKRFVNAVNPEHVVFSVGYQHHFGHPHKSVMQRYLSNNTQMWRTDRHGTIHFIWDEHQVLKVDSYFRSNKGFLEIDNL